MNCKSFEIVVMDLARDAAMAAESRQKLSEHVSGCSQCAGAVAVERSLTEGLRMLAGSSRDQTAPPRVEAALRNTFRTRANSAAPRAGHRRFVTRLGVGLAAAALVVLACSTPLVRNLIPAGTTPGLQQERPSRLKPESPGVQLPSPGVAGKEKQRALADQLASSPPASTQHRRIRRVTSSDDDAADTGDGFVPLLYEEEPGPLEGGQVVRVSLPRSMLARFGFAVNTETADQPISAEVLVGNDGVARSIRLTDSASKPR